jgi:peptidoglycan hydrolase-like protein with peptidoglycan-binding domain
MLRLKERYLEGTPGFAVFFDNIRVDQYVKSFQVNISSDGSIGNASVEMIYVPDFYKIETTDPETGDIISVEMGIENMTNVKIFVRNMFSLKYIMVFDGNIRGKSRTKSPSGYTLVFTASDYLTWLNRTIVPIAIPLESQLALGDTLKWKAQGIDIFNTPSISRVANGVFRGQTLQTFIGKMQETTLKLNKFYADTASVAYWDGAQGRIDIMGDISDELIQNKVIDFVVTSSATFVNSMYVGINDIVKNLMFEFYQDRDGVIRIKPPFWNEKVLYDHVIEPLLIMNMAENTNWNNYITRVVITGGLEDQQEDFDNVQKSIVTPCGAYVGDDDPAKALWTDYQSGDTGTMTQTIATGGKGTWLSSHEMFSPYMQYRGLKTDGSPRYHFGQDYAMPIGTPVYHIGAKGVAARGNDPQGWGDYVQVRLVEGPFKGYFIVYAHLSEIICSSGDIITDGSLLGKSGKSGNANTPDNRDHLHLSVCLSQVGERGGTIDPDDYFQRSLGEDNGSVAFKSSGSSSLLIPSTDERKYGVSVYDTVQPLIKFSNSAVIDQNSQGKRALEKYAKFLYNMTNSMVETATLQTVAMPWIRPGFNVWVDPVAVDKVYYVHSVSHYGSAEGGCFSTLNLSLGRERIKFTNSTGFASMKNQGGENLFISKFNVHSSDFGKVLDSDADFAKIRKQMVGFYQNETTGMISADKNSYFKELYYITNSDPAYKSSSQATQTTTTSAPAQVTINVGADEFNIDAWPVSMGQGYEGAHVEELQKALKRMGTYTEGYTDQVFGQITKKAVIDFQTKFSLDSDGVVGKFTKAKLKEELGKLGTTTTATASGSTTSTATSVTKLSPSLFIAENTIEDIQTILNSAYENAPTVVKDRISKNKKIITNSAEYIKLHYISELTNK